MKLFRLIGTMTIVAAVAATMAVSASALTATYADNTVTLDSVAEATASDYTVVVTSAAVGNDTTEGDIFQLAQSEVAPTTIAVPADLAPGKYYVRVGGYTDGYAYAEFVKTQTDAVADADLINQDGAEDLAVAWYVVNIEDVPTSLVPYWTNGIKKIPAVADMANIEGGLKLGLTVAGATEVDANMALIWE